jgi:hypothetical protein
MPVQAGASILFPECLDISGLAGTQGGDRCHPKAHLTFLTTAYGRPRSRFRAWGRLEAARSLRYGSQRVTNSEALAYKPRANLLEIQGWEDDLVIPAGVEPAFPT